MVPQPIFSPLIDPAVTGWVTTRGPAAGVLTAMAVGVGASGGPCVEGTGEAEGAPLKLQANPARTRKDVRRVSDLRRVDIVATFPSEGIRPGALRRGRRSVNHSASIGRRQRDRR